MSSCGEGPTRARSSTRAAIALAAGLVAASVTGASTAWCAGALASLAQQVAKGLGPLKGDALVVSGLPVSDVSPVRAEELASRAAQLVAGALGGTAHAATPSATLDRARALAGAAGQLVFVQVEIAKGQVRATVDVYPVPSNAWDRARAPVPPPRGHVFAEAPLDAEVRAFLPSIPLEHATLHRATHAEGDVLAVACGDLDGDGGEELALVSRARVAVGHVVAGTFVPARVVPWSRLAPRVGAPMREPLAGAVFRRDGDRGSLRVGTTDRGGVVLDESLALSGALRGVPVPGDACATPSATTSAFEGDLTTCADAAGALVIAAPAPRYDAFAAGAITAADGAVRAASIARAPDGKLLARLGEAQTSIDGVGAQVALADLDLDGAPEIAASTDADDDAIRVWSWDGATDPRLRATYPAPDGVRALAACPPEEGGKPALVAVVGNEVWIVR